MAIRLWGNEKLVNSTTSFDQRAPVVTSLQNGGYVIAWIDETGTGTSAIKFQRFDGLGNKVGAETAVPSLDGEGDQDQVSIASLPNGNFVIVNRDVDPAGGSDGSISIFNPLGVLVTQTQVLLSTSNVETDFSVSPSYVYGDFAVIFTTLQNNTNSDPSVITYDVNGSALSQTLIDPSISVQHSPAIAYSSSGLPYYASVYIDDSLPNPNNGKLILRIDQSTSYTIDSLASDPHIAKIGFELTDLVIPKWAVSYTKGDSVVLK
jgi:hypothetical protein